MSDRTARSNYSPLLSQRQGAKSFSQGFWPCHSTDRASGTFSAITASGATRTVKPKKTTDSCAGNRLTSHSTRRTGSSGAGEPTHCD